VRAHSPRTGWRLLGPLVAAALAATALAIYVDPQPAGHPIADRVWSIGAALAAVYVARNARPWFWILVSGVGAVAGGSVAIVLSAVLGAFGLLIAKRVGFTGAPLEGASLGLSLAGSVAAVSSTAVLFFLDDFGMTGLSAAIALAVVGVGLCDTARRRSGVHAKPTVPLATSRFARFAIGVVVGFGIWVGLEALAFRDQVTSLQALSSDMVSAARAVDLERLENLTETAESEVTVANEHLDSFPIRLLEPFPLAGPNTRAARETGHDAAAVLEAVENMLEVTLDVDSAFVGGTIAVEELTPVAASLDEVIAAAQVLEDTVGLHLEGQWLAPPLRTQLSKVDEALGVLPGGQLSAVETHSAIFGVAEPRSYLVLLGNPAETRELGGFTGATAVISVDDGKIELTETLRNGMLNRSEAPVSALTAPLPARYLEHRPHLFSQNYTATSDLPTVADALENIFPEVAGYEIDGVIYMDAIAADAMVALTGEVSAPTLGRSFGSNEVAPFLTRTQYSTDFSSRGEREGIFAELAESAFTELTDPALTIDREALTQIVRVAQEGRLAFAPTDDQELSWLSPLGMTGSIGELRPEADYLAMSTVNAGPNKLDAYLHRSVHYDVSIEDGKLHADVNITLENHAPTDLSEYAGGNGFDLPLGTNRLTVVIHTPHELVEWSGADAEPAMTRSFFEYGRWRHERIVHVPAGEAVEVVVSLAGVAPTGEYQLDVDAQPVVHADWFSATMTEGGSASEFVRGRLRRDTTFGPVR